MTLTRKTQIGLVITTLVLFVLLFLAPKTHSDKKSDSKIMTNSSQLLTSIEPFLNKTVQSLKEDDKLKYQTLIFELLASLTSA